MSCLFAENIISCKDVVLWSIFNGSLTFILLWISISTTISTNVIYQKIKEKKFKLTHCPIIIFLAILGVYVILWFMFFLFWLIVSLLYYLGIPLGP
jgi:hypothetical protein